MAHISLAYCPSMSAWMLNYNVKKFWCNVWNLPDFTIIQLGFIRYKVELTKMNL